MKQPWSISTREHPGDRESLLRRGNLYQIANGYMGYRGTLDEFGPEQAVGITLAGLFDQVGSAWREPVNAPNGAFTRVALDGAGLSALGPRVRRHRQTLDFTNARFERETTFAGRGKTLTLRSERILSAATPNLGLTRLTVTCDRAARVTIRTGIDGNIWDLNGPHLPHLEMEKCGDVLLVHGRTHQLRKQVVVAEAIAHGLAGEIHEVKDGRNLRVVTFHAEAGRAYTLVKYFAVFTDNDRVGRPLTEAAVEAVRQARALGYEQCLARHDQEWAEKWERCDVRIDGDDEAQLALRYSTLQLLMAAPLPGSANSIPARALSGQVYKGAVFWDTEMFILPFFLHTWPERAAELLRYRIRTLDGARRKARTEVPGYRGAFYAWESQDTGDEACTYYNVGDPFTGRALRTYFRDKQVHISGDVAIAMWRYFQLTGDDSLLREGGAEVILECARFYSSYLYFKADKSRYEVLDVTGPDEYHERVNNNAFTNAGVKETFRIAGAVVDHFRGHHPGILRTLVRKLGIGRELRAFAQVAKRLYVPEPAADSGLIEQFDGYFQLKDSSVSEVKSRMVHPNEYLGAAQGLAVPTQVIKQADVVMMLNLFRTRYPAAVKRTNWANYEPRTEHGSSLSACAYAMVATEFGELESAYRYFLQTAKIDLEAKYKLYVGTIFMGGSHPAANGGAWMTAVQGFGGVQTDGERLVINPRLRAKWRRLQFNLVYRGDRFRIAIEADVVTIEADRSNRRTHAIVVAGRPTPCRPGRSVAVRYQPAQAA